MGNPQIRERLAEKLLSSSSRQKLGVAAFCLLLATPFMWMTWEPENNFRVPFVDSENREPNANPLSLQVSDQEGLPEQVKKTIEGLFEEVEKNPDLREKLLRELKRVLQETFAGQEDCWSCEGTAYFDRFDRIAGKGEARKPLGLREWVEQGEEAYQNEDHELARRFYSKALQVMDERVFQPEEGIDEGLIEKLQSRCVELDCR